MNAHLLSNLKTEAIREMVARHKTLISILLLVLISSIHVPIKVNTPLFLALCPLIFVYKNEVFPRREFRFLFYFFCSYLFIFTLLSENIPKSLVADFKVIRAFFFFPLAGLFFFLVKGIKDILPHSTIIFVCVVSNFLFIKKHIVPNETYFSYYNHPNLAGFSLFFLIVLAIFLLNMSKKNAEKILNLFTIIVSLFLIMITNSRSIWLGLILFFLSAIFFIKKIRRRLKIIFSFTLIFIAALLFFLLDSKNSLESMSIRNVLWTTTYDDTIQNHPWTGYGFGTFKIYFTKLKDIGLMPHNSLVEIFQSSGILGSMMMSIIFILLFFISYKIYKYKQNAVYSRMVIISCSALIALLAISLFDFRFFDYQFMATAMVLLGFLNIATPTRLNIDGQK